MITATKYRESCFKRFGVDYPIYSQREADRLNIPYSTEWRRNWPSRDDMILTDDRLVLPVLNPHKNFIVVPGCTYKRRDLYLLPRTAGTTYYKSSIMNRATPVNVEFLIAIAFLKLLSMRAAVSYVWNTKDTKFIRLLSAKIDNNLHFRGFIVHAIEQLFKAANVDPSKCISRMDKNADLSIDAMRKLLEQDTVDIEKVMKLATLNHKLNQDMVNFSIGDSFGLPSAANETFLLPAQE